PGMLRRIVCDEEEEAGALKAAERLQSLPGRPRTWTPAPGALGWRKHRWLQPSAHLVHKAFRRLPVATPSHAPRPPSGGGQGAGGPDTSSRPSTPLQHTRGSCWLEPAHATRRQHTPDYCRCHGVAWRGVAWRGVAWRAAGYSHSRSGLRSAEQPDAIAG